MAPVYSKLSPSPLSISPGPVASGSRIIYVTSSPERAGPSGLSAPGAHGAASLYNHSGGETQFDFGNIYTEVGNLRLEIAHLKNENAHLRGQATTITYVSNSTLLRPVTMAFFQPAVQFASQRYNSKDRCNKGRCRVDRQTYSPSKLAIRFHPNPLYISRVSL